MTAAGWRAWGGVVLAVGAVALAALAMPVHLPEGGAAADPADLLPGEVAGEAAPEDLGAFLASRRWGVFEPEVTEPAPPPAPPEDPDPAPEFMKIGFVGLIVTGDERVVLLRTPEGKVARVAPGAVLPDGRVLISVSDDRLVLRSEGRPDEVLTLFPPVPTGPLADNAPPPAPTGPADPPGHVALPVAPGEEDGRGTGAFAAAVSAAGSPASR